MRPLVITPGDPDGVGPEVACRALAQRRSAGQPVHAVLVGDAAALVPEAEREGLTLVEVDHIGPVEGTAVAVLDPGDHPEPVEVASIREAVRACLAGRASGLVTGPIHKAKLSARGFDHPGHTGFLGALCGVERPVMAFVGGRLAVALVTTHLPLAQVADRLRPDDIVHVLRVADAALRDQLRLDTRRLLVCGLNPHAGDDGLLGTEERRIIAPAVQAARAEGVEAIGPMSAEAAFLKAAAGHGEMVVAMYHDQGLVPLKLVDFGRSVNWTLGLPMVRTSVDHGTAYDIAGTHRADASSMLAAIAVAERLVGHRTD